MAKTRVWDRGGRLVVELLTEGGAVDEWIELPSSLKQPLMAMCAEVAEGAREQSDYPVPGGDSLVITRLEGAASGGLHGIHLERQPIGFPPEGRDVEIPADAIPALLSQVRAV